MGSKEFVLLLRLALVKAVGIMSVLMSATQEGCWQIGGSSEKNHKNMNERKGCKMESLHRVSLFRFSVSK